MMARRSAGERPGFRSTSTPRRRKSTAAGDNLSLIRTFDMGRTRWLFVSWWRCPLPQPPPTRGGGVINQSTKQTDDSPLAGGGWGKGATTLFRSLRRKLSGDDV